MSRAGGVEMDHRSECIEAVLRDCLEYFKERYDVVVVDGDDGKPKPNLEMQMGIIIEAVLQED